MKSLKQIIDRFEKDLKKNGITTFIVSVRDPDSDQFYFNYGDDYLWQRGAADYIKDQLGGAHVILEQDDDEEEDY